MELTQDQKQLIVSKAAGLDSASLVIPLLEDHIFPWVESQEDLSEEQDDTTAIEIKQLALDYLMTQLRKHLPDLTDMELLESLPAEQYRKAVVLTAMAIKLVGQIIVFDTKAELAAKEAAQNLDEEYKNMFE